MRKGTSTLPRQIINKNVPSSIPRRRADALRVELRSRDKINLYITTNFSILYFSIIVRLPLELSVFLFGGMTSKLLLNIYHLHYQQLRLVKFISKTCTKVNQTKYEPSTQRKN